MSTVTLTQEIIPDYFSYEKDPIKRDKLNRLRFLMTRYRELEFGRISGNTIADYLYDGLGQWRYSDNIYEYPDQLFKLLKAMAIPEIANAIKEHGELDIKKVLEAIEALHNMIKGLDNRMYTSEFEIIELNYHGELTYQQLDTMIDEYEERVRSSATGKVRNYY